MSNFYVSGAAAMTSDSMEWTTPRDLFDELDAEFRFDLDAASTHENALCERHWTMAEDGLEMPWEGHVWCNPPYGRGIGKWVRKAAESNRGGHSHARPREDGHGLVARLGGSLRHRGQVHSGAAQVRGRGRIRAVPQRDRGVRPQEV